MEICLEAVIQTDRQTEKLNEDRQKADRQTEGHTVRKTDIGQADRQTNRQTD